MEVVGQGTLEGSYSVSTPLWHTSPAIFRYLDKEKERMRGGGREWPATIFNLPTPLLCVNCLWILLPSAGL